MKNQYRGEDYLKRAGGGLDSLPILEGELSKKERGLIPQCTLCTKPLKKVIYNFSKWAKQWCQNMGI